jgi:alpha-tubulin suppressor-like RCC1 family protein
VILVRKIVEGKDVPDFSNRKMFREKFIPATDTKSYLFTWGSGRGNVLGHNSCEDVVVPKLVEGLRTERIRQFSCGAYHMGVSTTDGMLFMQGEKKQICASAPSTLWDVGFIGQLVTYILTYSSRTLLK